MVSKVLIEVLEVVYNYLIRFYSAYDISIVWKEIENIVGVSFSKNSRQHKEIISYEEVQEILSSLNEKGSNRKNKGVYYTPKDVVRFILFNSVKMSFGKLTDRNLSEIELTNIPYKMFCYNKSVFDPTCGSGAFLLEMISCKFDLLEFNNVKIDNDVLKRVIETVHGNDINSDSIAITKIRIVLLVLERYGSIPVKGIADVLEKCYTCCDYVESGRNLISKYDVIIGNPPYVEDRKTSSCPREKYGNIYANVLANASLQLKEKGVMGFVIPLSYISTPRMRKIRKKLSDVISEQYIFSYADRPDSLFLSVHQKLCIILGIKSNQNVIYTSNYKYWYKNERNNLFKNISVIKNDFLEDGYIPKLGTNLDVSIYKKVKSGSNSIFEILNTGEVPVYLNMRATFWIKAFIKEHRGGEYKMFGCSNEGYANLCFCLLNSSLFWWYWTCVSDCWHITRKELTGFNVPEVDNFEKANELAILLENKLEETKKYVGTKQVEYEYKHKECIDVISLIDNYVFRLYGLNDVESEYIRKFFYKYRNGGKI